MSPVAAFALVPADASADAAGGASLPGAVVVEGLPPQAAATSTAALAPLSNRRRMPPERFVMVLLLRVAGTLPRRWMAEAVDRASWEGTGGTRHGLPRSTRDRSHRQGDGMGT